MSLFKKSPNNPKAKEYVTKPPEACPILPAEKLLQTKRLQKVLRDLPGIVNAPTKIYDALYYQTILNFADLVQGLPAFNVNPYNFHGGMLELGIERAFLGLSLYRKQESIDGIKPQDMPGKLALWTYAVFTAGLLYNIGLLVSHFYVSLCDENGRNNREWRPLLQSMTDAPETHYRYAWESETQWEYLCHAVSPPLVAKNILPPVGLDWIASDREVLEYWLAVLRNDEERARLLAKFIFPAQWQLIEAANERLGLHHGTGHLPYSDEKTKKAGMRKAFDRSMPFATPSTDTPGTESSTRFGDVSRGKAKTAMNISGTAAMEIGDEFLNWLRKIAVKGTSLSVQRTRDGLLIVTPEAFKEFVKTHPGKYSWESVYKSFVGLGYTEILRGKQHVHKYSLGGGKGELNALLIKNHNLIIHGAALPAINKDLQPSTLQSNPNYPNLAGAKPSPEPNPRG